MTRLFVDVDDTLVIYPEHMPGPNPLSVSHGVSCTANESLITAIHNWLKMNTAGQVVIRSGWDEEYARGIAAGLILDIDAWYFTKAGQNLGLPGQGDTVVDDDPDSLGTEMVRPENMLPDQFIELMGG